MAKTMALFFVFGFLVSCASYHNERTISSVEQDKTVPHVQTYDRFR